MSAPRRRGLGVSLALTAGVDEAGRGPLAGPVVAAAVILDDLNPIAGLADSKVLTARRREQLFDEIRAKALACCIAEASVEEIDSLNILQATLLAMRRAVEGLRLIPQRVLVDGRQVPQLRMPAQAIVKGDAKVAEISAASILAKVYRDRLCAGLHAAGDVQRPVEDEGNEEEERNRADDRREPVHPHEPRDPPMQAVEQRVELSGFDHRSCRSWGAGVVRQRWKIGRKR